MKDLDVEMGKYSEIWIYNSLFPCNRLYSKEKEYLYLDNAKSGSKEQKYLWRMEIGQEVRAYGEVYVLYYPVGWAGNVDPLVHGPAFVKENTYSRRL